MIRAEPPFFAVESLEAVVEQIRIPMAIGEPSTTSASTAPRRQSRPRRRGRRSRVGEHAAGSGLGRPASVGSSLKHHPGAAPNPTA